MEVTQAYQEGGNMGKVLPDYLSEWTTEKGIFFPVCKSSLFYSVFPFSEVGGRNSNAKLSYQFCYQGGGESVEGADGRREEHQH